MATYELMNNIFFNEEIDDKFKSNYLSLRFILPLDKKTSTQYALILYILKIGCEKYKDRISLNRKLNDLYGANFFTEIETVGGYQILEFGIQFIDEQYTINKESMIEESCLILCSIIMNPYLVDGFFLNKNVSIAKQMLLDTIEAQINNKGQFAYNRCIEIMYDGLPLSVNKYGYKYDIDKLTDKLILSAYYNMLKESKIYISYIGRDDKKTVENILVNKFSNVDKNCKFNIKYSGNSINDVIKDEEEVCDISQSKMVMGFKLDKKDYNLNDIRVTNIMNIIYGSGPFSKLFVNVREKMSLCYSCFSKFDKFKRAILVELGIERDKKQEAKTEILMQLNKMRIGDFSIEDINKSLLLMKDNLWKLKDSVRNMNKWYFNQFMIGNGLLIDDEINLISKVSKDEIVRMANLLRLDTVYLLKGNDIEDEH